MDDPDRAAGMRIAGAIDKMDHRDLYHHLLDMPNSQWEAIRESAHQMLGGAASHMWGDMGYDSEEDKKGGAYNIGGGHSREYNMHDLKDILMTPSPAAAARMLELEHDAKGSGFKSAVKKAWKGSQKLLKGASKGLNKVHSALGDINEITSAMSQQPGPLGEYATNLNKVGKEAQSAVKAVQDATEATGEASGKDIKKTILEGLKNPETYKKINEIADKVGAAKEAGAMEHKEEKEEKEAGGQNIGGAVHEIVGSGMSGMDMKPMHVESVPEPAPKKKRGGGGKGKSCGAGLRKPKPVKAKEPKVTISKPKKNMKQPEPEAISLVQLGESKMEPVVKFKSASKSHDPRKKR